MNSHHSKDLVYNLAGSIEQYNATAEAHYKVSKEEERRTELDFIFESPAQKFELYFQITTGDFNQFLLLLFKRTEKKSKKKSQVNFRYDFDKRHWVSKEGVSYTADELVLYIKDLF